MQPPSLAESVFVINKTTTIATAINIWVVRLESKPNNIHIYTLATQATTANKAG